MWGGVVECGVIAAAQDLHTFAILIILIKGSRIHCNRGGFGTIIRIFWRFDTDQRDPVCALRVQLPRQARTGSSRASLASASNACSSNAGVAQGKGDAYKGEKGAEWGGKQMMARNGGGKRLLCLPDHI